MRASAVSSSQQSWVDDRGEGKEEGQGGEEDKEEEEVEDDDDDDEEVVEDGDDEEEEEVVDDDEEEEVEDGKERAYDLAMRTIITKVGFAAIILCSMVISGDHRHTRACSSTSLARFLPQKVSRSTS